MIDRVEALFAVLGVVPWIGPVRAVRVVDAVEATEKVPVVTDEMVLRAWNEFVWRDGIASHHQTRLRAMRAALESALRGDEQPWRCPVVELSTKDDNCG